MPTIRRPEDYKTSTNTWTDAIEDMHAAGADGDVFEFAAFTYPIVRPLVFNLWQNVSFIGAGASTELRYTGSTANIDFIKFGGVTGTQKGGYLVRDIRITSATSMTAGNAVHVHNMFRSNFERVMVDGADGTTWYDGWHFNEVDYTSLDHGGTITVKNTALKLNGKNNVTGAQAGFFLTATKLTGKAGAGLHIGGAYGGTYFSGVDIINSMYGVKIDQALANYPNREVMFSNTTSIDGSKKIGVLIDQGNSNFYLNLGGAWIASTAVTVTEGVPDPETGHGIYLKSSPNIRVCGTAYLYANRWHGFFNKEAAASGRPVLHGVDSGSTVGSYSFGAAFWDASNNGAGTSSGLTPQVCGSNNKEGLLQQPLPPAIRDHMTRVAMRQLLVTEGWSVGAENTEFYSKFDGSGYPVINFDNNEYIQWDRYWNALKVKVGGGTVLNAGQNGTIFRITENAMPLTENLQFGFYRQTNSQVVFALQGTDGIVRTTTLNLT